MVSQFVHSFLIVTHTLLLLRSSFLNYWLTIKVCCSDTCSHKVSFSSLCIHSRILSPISQTLLVPSHSISLCNLLLPLNSNDSRLFTTQSIQCSLHFILINSHQFTLTIPSYTIPLTRLSYPSILTTMNNHTFTLAFQLPKQKIVWPLTRPFNISQFK
jgi:hypothetical protein